MMSGAINLRKASPIDLAKLVSARVVRMSELTSANGLATVARTLAAKNPRDRVYLVLVSG